MVETALSALARAAAAAGTGSRGARPHWLGIHLAPVGPIERGFWAEVMRCIREEYDGGVVRACFFVRYYAPCPHVRVRFACRGPAATRSLQRRLAARFTRNPRCTQVPGEDLFVRYVPETKRYGGHAGLDLCEHYFCLSSEIARLRLGRSGNASRERMLGSSILLAAGTLRGMFPLPDERDCFLWQSTRLFVEGTARARRLTEQAVWQEASGLADALTHSNDLAPAVAAAMGDAVESLPYWLRANVQGCRLLGRAIDGSSRITGHFRRNNPGYPAARQEAERLAGRRLPAGFFARAHLTSSLWHMTDNRLGLDNMEELAFRIALRGLLARIR